MTQVLRLGIPEFLEGTIAAMVAFVPRRHFVSAPLFLPRTSTEETDLCGSTDSPGETINGFYPLVDIRTLCDTDSRSPLLPHIVR